jgi:hypothetical protein
MSKIRNIVIGAVAVAAPFALIAAPAGAAQSHPKYIKAIEHVNPYLKGYKVSFLTGLGNAICGDLRAGNSIADEANQLVESNNNPLTYKQDGVVLAGAVYFICPSYINALNNWTNSFSGSQTSVTSNSGESVDYVVPTGFAPYRLLNTVVSGGTLLNPVVSA